MITRILALIEQNKITANKLTADLALPSSAITEWKKGKAKPSTDAIIKISKYFGVSADFLLTGEESISDLYMQLNEENQKIILDEIKSMLNK